MECFDFDALRALAVDALAAVDRARAAATTADRADTLAGAARRADTLARVALRGHSYFAYAEFLERQSRLPLDRD